MALARFILPRQLLCAIWSSNVDPGAPPAAAAPADGDGARSAEAASGGPTCPAFAPPVRRLRAWRYAGHRTALVVLHLLPLPPVPRDRVLCASDGARRLRITLNQGQGPKERILNRTPPRLRAGAAPAAGGLSNPGSMAKARRGYSTRYPSKRRSQLDDICSYSPGQVAARSSGR